MLIRAIVVDVALVHGCSGCEFSAQGNLNLILIHEIFVEHLIVIFRGCLL